jgi:hypothetical protein
MNRSKLDALWHEAEEQSRKEGVMYTRYHFAALVEADVRKAMMQLFTDPENQPTQHGTVTVEYMQRFMAAERQIVVDSLRKQAELAADDFDRRWALEMAAAVAARNNT